MNAQDSRLSELGINPENIFILHPSNAAFMRGEASQPNFPPTSTQVQYGNPAAVFFLVVAIALCILLYPVVVAHVGVLADGQVIRTYKATGYRGSDTFHVEFSFTAGGVAYDVNQMADQGLLDQAYNGQKNVKVKYLAQLPSVATIVDSTLVTPISAPFLLNIAALGGVILCLIFIAGILLRAFRLRLLRERRKHSWPSAAIVVGQIVSCRGTPHFSRTQSWYAVSVNYRYRRPGTDEMIDGDDTGHRRDLRDNLPPPGTPVLIVVYGGGLGEFML